MQTTLRRLACLCGALILSLGITACGGAQPAAGPVAEIPATLSATGNAERGKVYFEGPGTCSACHSTGTNKMVGPGLAGVMTTVGPVHDAGVTYNGNLPNGKPRTEENIAEWVRSGGQGKVGVMSPHPMSDAEIADLLAYLRTLKK